jgi:RHS repeat-associated protein
MFSRQNIPDKGLICEILWNKDLAGNGRQFVPKREFHRRKHSLISKKNFSGSELVLRSLGAVAPVPSFTKWIAVVCDERHSVFVTFHFPFRETRRGAPGDADFKKIIGSVASRPGLLSSPVYCPRFILYSPIGKLGLMNGQTANTIRVPLPGGSMAELVGSTGGTKRTLHTDWLGSSRLATSYASRVLSYDAAYAPYGENYAGKGTATTDLDFTGQFQDTSTGLYDFLYREYNPVQGRWITPTRQGKRPWILPTRRAGIVMRTWSTTR